MHVQLKFMSYLGDTLCRFPLRLACADKTGEEQNREEGEMAQERLGGGRNRGKSKEKK